MRKRILKDNRGLTLVEMLVSFAILSIMMVAVFQFMSMMTKQYQNSNNEITVQNEVQTLMQQLENYIIDADMGVELDEGTYYDLYVMSSDGFCVISYDGSEDVRELYYYDYTTYWKDNSITVTKETAYSVASAYHSGYTATKNLLAEYVATFKLVDPLSETLNAENNYVALEIRIEKTNRSYTATKNIYLRNQIVTPSPTAAGSSTATPTPTATDTPTPTA